jgi:succinate dehydrogenase assembly factor 1
VLTRGLSSHRMAQAPRLSGLAKQAFSLHRALLRAARAKPDDARPAIVTRIRAEFDLRRALDPLREMQQIEHFLRHGRKQLERLRDPNVKAIMGPPPS